MSNNHQHSKFHIDKIPLTGVHLIEAGAGTGKTYALTILVIRLLLKYKLNIREILVVTYTVAATKELRFRIRQKIQETLNAFYKIRILDSSIQKIVNNTSDNLTAIKLLENALHDFDTASIFTIHGFCQHMLHEHAFEIGEIFDTELLVDNYKLRTEILNEFWQKQFYDMHKDYFRYIQKKINFQNIKNIINKNFIEMPIQIIPAIKAINFSTLELNNIKNDFFKFKEKWDKLKQETIFLDIKINTFSFKLKKFLSNIDEYFSSENIFPLLKNLKKFDFNSLIKNLKYKNEHNILSILSFILEVKNFFNMVSLIELKMDNKILLLKKEMILYFRAELIRRKLLLKLRSYDDLLINFNKALYSKHGLDLLKLIRKRYKAALIDEFQDTDYIQYSIFNRIFVNYKEAIMFLIGDPKQAIYSFRGADIFTYIKVSSTIENRHTLITNRRSEPGLITALNLILNQSKNPFLIENIEFKKARSEPHNNLKYLISDDKIKTPFNIWILQKKNKSFSKIESKQIIADKISIEITKLIKLGQIGKAVLGNKNLTENDIAILVRKHKDALVIQNSLQKNNITSVIYSNKNIFTTKESLELERLLKAIENPNSEELFRVALTTELIGISAKNIYNIIHNSKLKKDKKSFFQKLKKIWEKNGFLKMYRFLFKENKIRERLICLPNGERKITNYFHLGELLHQIHSEQKLEIFQIVEWLKLRRINSSYDIRQETPENYQLRLANDNNAVKILTIHMSKGLEFPVVFCPYSWDNIYLNKNFFVYHDPNDQLKPKLSVHNTLNSEIEIQKNLEILAEEIRLLYVALTRAQNRCYLIWGCIEDSLLSALAYIFFSTHINKNKKNQNFKLILSIFKKEISNYSVEELTQIITNLANNSKKTINISFFTENNFYPIKVGFEKKSNDLINVCNFTRNIEKTWCITSFSELSQKLTFKEFIFKKKIERINFKKKAKLTITMFPKGKHSGIFFHKLFENINFQYLNNIDDYIKLKLIEYNYGEEWIPIIKKMISNVLNINLNKKNLKLSNISNKDRINELEFYISVNKKINIFSLIKILKKFYKKFQFNFDITNNFKELELFTFSGFIHGFIDLIFLYNDQYYLLDWKSNFLGYYNNDYNKKNIYLSMNKHLYILQYHIYCLALHKFLQKNLFQYSYKKNFGSIFYIYLRAFGGKNPQYGLFKAKPKQDLIEELDKQIY